MKYLRFLSKTPNPFLDPESSDFVELAKDYFKPSNTGDRQISLWRDSESERILIIAGFISQKSSEPQNQRVLVIDFEVFNEASSEVNQKNTVKGFSCIQRNHYTCVFLDDDLELFLRKLQRSLSTKSQDENILSYNRAKIHQLLKDAESLCHSYERELCGNWVENILNKK